MVIGGRPPWNDVYPRSFECVLLNHDDSVSCHQICLVVWNMFCFSIYWECHHPNWWTHIFQRSRYTTNQLSNLPHISFWWLSQGNHHIGKFSPQKQQDIDLPSPSSDFPFAGHSLAAVQPIRNTHFNTKEGYCVLSVWWSPCILIGYTLRYSLKVFGGIIQRTLSYVFSMSVKLLSS